MWPLMYIGHFSKGQIHCVVGSAGKILIAVVLSVTWFITLRSPKCSNPLTSSTQVLPTRKHSAVLAVCKRKKKEKEKEMDLYSFLSAVIHLMRFLHQHPLENAMNTHRKLELGVGYCGLLYTYIYIYIQCFFTFNDLSRWAGFNDHDSIG